MGLFRKNNEDAARIAELKAEIQEMRQRLDEADAAKARLEARVDETEAAKVGLEERVSSIAALSEQVGSQAGDVNSLSSQVRQITERLDAPPPKPTPTPPPPPKPVDTDLVDERVEGVERRLAELDAVNERLDALSSAVTQQARETLEQADQVDPGQIGDMANRLEDLSVAVATHTTQLAATKERVDAIEPVAGQAAEDDTREVVDEMRQQLGQMAERMTSLDRRLTNVSTELANQLTELSRDIDTMSHPQAPTLPPPSAAAGAEPDLGIDHLDTDELELRLAEKFDMAIDDVRDSQERLAAEQARYEIKFREDLAELAERLRRPRHD